MRTAIVASVFVIGAGWASAQDSAVSEDIDPDSKRVTLHASLGAAQAGKTTYSSIELSLSADKKKGHVSITFYEERERSSCKGKMDLYAGKKRIKMKGKAVLSGAHKTVAGPDGFSDGFMTQSLTAKFSRRAVRKLAKAKRMRIKACGITAELTKEQRAIVADFAGRL